MVNTQDKFLLKEKDFENDFLRECLKKKVESFSSSFEIYITSPETGIF